MSSKGAQKFLLLVLPALAWFYIGLFVTIQLWYPGGLSTELFVDHIQHFSFIYIMWMLVFFVFTLFDIPTFQRSSAIISRLLGAMLTNALIAVSYFYFQPELILTPRRFLLVHILATTIGLALWYAMIQYFLPRVWQKNLYLHESLFDQDLHTEVQDYLSQVTSGWIYKGRFQGSEQVNYQKTTVMLPASPSLAAEELSNLFELKRRGLEFLEYHKFVEQTQRMIPLSKVSEAWFLRSVSYNSHQLYDSVKRVLDIVFGFLGVLVLALLLPVLAVLIKLDSKGSVFFVQPRVGKGGQPFKLYKLRTMSGGATDTWTGEQDSRITKVGKVLRKLRIDELPQFINILLGNMSLVGPRPEQVHIVQELKTLIPYYDERHIVKPGLTGWSQLHVYANSLDGTRLKLQYDFYYIKHRSLLFDIEIVLRTIFHIISLQGK